MPIPKIEKPKKCRANPSRFEKVLMVERQSEKCLGDNNIITEHPSAFRKRYLCETAIQTIIDEWKLTVRGK